MKYTASLNLKKPEGTDVIDINDLNGNTDIIDMEITKKATQTLDGRMSKEDKAKLDGIEEGANKYQHPATHSLDSITETTTKKIMTDIERSKLASIEVNANNYIHPSTHPATMIAQDSNHRFVTDTEKSIWNGKAEQSDLDIVSAQTADLATNKDTATDGQVLTANGDGTSTFKTLDIPQPIDVDKGRYQAEFGFDGASYNNCELISNEQVDLKYSTTSYVDSPTLNASSARTIPQGIAIVPNNELSSLILQISSSCSGYKNAVIKRYSDGVVMATKDISTVTPGSSFAISELSLLPGIKYTITMDNGVNSYSARLMTTPVFPYNSTLFNVTDGVSDDLTLNSSYYANFTRIEAIGYVGSTSGTATKTTTPSDLKKWGNMKYEASVPANTSVDVKILSNDVWDESGTSPGADWEALEYYEGKIYAKQASSPYKIWIYNINTNTWDKSTGTSPSNDYSFSVVVNDKKYVKQASSPYKIWIYHITHNTWDESSGGTPSENWGYPVYDEVNIIYARRLSDHKVIKYNVSTNTWDESSGVAPSGSWSYAVYYNNKIYAKRDSDNKIIIYDTDTNTWDESTGASYSSTWYASVLVNGKVYSREASSPYKIIEYDIANNLFIDLDAPSDIWNLSATDGVKIYVRSANFNVWAYTFPKVIKSHTSTEGENIIDLNDVSVTTYSSLKTKFTLNRNTVDDESPTVSDFSITWEGEDILVDKNNGATYKLAVIDGQPFLEVVSI